MPAGRYDITIEQGATLTLHFQWKEDDVAVPLVTDGWHARMKVRELHSSVSALLSASDGTGEITLDNDGKILIVVPASVTELLPIPAKFCVWDLEVYQNSGYVKRLLEGRAYITPEATK